ncbi:SGNH/GDSL hydrolase family protein [Ferruginibacter albus]|uniref:SGNH/GDSL hydrolase family protein n=1 Tax=Ferruginibacter albus TaxID=2875540 RepID=UPI001CC6954F|nr:SGNH/GDSL hydrolase family protein [Ferruginibacter albus]UAY50882.1 SGNH/GDSL hydrolase family protein [Ferruginibacter albus]
MKTIILFEFLLVLLQGTSSCSKPSIYQMPVIPIDTTITTPPIDTTVTIPVDTIPNNPPDTSTKTYLALGDSYTIGQSIPAAQNYPNQTVTILNNNVYHFAPPEIIAVTGWTTANLLNAISNKPATTPYDIVTLLIGVNNQYQGRTKAEYETEFTTLLQRSIAYAGDKPSHVVVLSIPDYAVSPFGQGSGITTYISAQIDSFNLINKHVSDAYHVNYLDITGISRQALNNPSLFASDGLHFSGKEYAIWSISLAGIIEKVLK